MEDEPFIAIENRPRLLDLRPGGGGGLQLRSEHEPPDDLVEGRRVRTSFVRIGDQGGDRLREISGMLVTGGHEPLRDRRLVRDPESKVRGGDAAAITPSQQHRQRPADVGFRCGPEVFDQQRGLQPGGAGGCEAGDQSAETLHESDAETADARSSSPASPVYRVS